MLIRIRRYTFTTPDRFTPGHPLTSGEAQALNQLLAENIRNNLDRLVDQEIAVCPPDTMLSREALERLQSEITRYGEAYQFKLNHKPKPLGPIERAAQSVAWERAEQEARFARWATDDPRITIRAQALLTDADVQEAARRRVAQADAIAKATLEDLL